MVREGAGCRTIRPCRRYHCPTLGYKGSDCAMARGRRAMRKRGGGKRDHDETGMKQEVHNEPSSTRGLAEPAIQEAETMEASATVAAATAETKLLSAKLEGLRETLLAAIDPNASGSERRRRREPGTPGRAIHRRLPDERDMTHADLVSSASEDEGAEGEEAGKGTKEGEDSHKKASDGKEKVSEPRSAVARLRQKIDAVMETHGLGGKGDDDDDDGDHDEVAAQRLMQNVELLHDVMEENEKERSLKMNREEARLHMQAYMEQLNVKNLFGEQERMDRMRSGMSMLSNGAMDGCGQFEKIVGSGEDTGGELPVKNDYINSYFTGFLRGEMWSQLGTSLRGERQHVEGGDAGREGGVSKENIVGNSERAKKASASYPSGDTTISAASNSSRSEPAKKAARRAMLRRLLHRGKGDSKGASSEDVGKMAAGQQHDDVRLVVDVGKLRERNMTSVSSMQHAQSNRGLGYEQADAIGLDIRKEEILAAQAHEREKKAAMIEKIRETEREREEFFEKLNQVGIFEEEEDDEEEEELDLRAAAGDGDEVKQASSDGESSDGAVEGNNDEAAFVAAERAAQSTLDNTHEARNVDLSDSDGADTSLPSSMEGDRELDEAARAAVREKLVKQMQEDAVTVGDSQFVDVAQEGSDDDEEDDEYGDNDSKAKQAVRDRKRRWKAWKRNEALDADDEDGDAACEVEEELREDELDEMVQAELDGGDDDENMRAAIALRRAQREARDAADTANVFRIVGGGAKLEARKRRREERLMDRKMRIYLARHGNRSAADMDRATLHEYMEQFLREEEPDFDGNVERFIGQADLPGDAVLEDDLGESEEEELEYMMQQDQERRKRDAEDDDLGKNYRRRGAGDDGESEDQEVVETSLVDGSAGRVRAKVTGVGRYAKMDRRPKKKPVSVGIVTHGAGIDQIVNQRQQKTAAGSGVHDSQTVGQTERGSTTHVQAPGDAAGTFKKRSRVGIDVTAPASNDQSNDNPPQGAEDGPPADGMSASEQTSGRATASVATIMNHGTRLSRTSAHRHGTAGRLRLTNKAALMKTLLQLEAVADAN